MARSRSRILEAPCYVPRPPSAPEWSRTSTVLFTPRGALNLLAGVTLRMPGYPSGGLECAIPCKRWLMQASSDILLGWLPAIGFDGAKHDFYVRQLWDGKRSVEIETLPPKGLEIYGRVCGWTLARAHARIGRPDRDRRLPRQGRELRSGDRRLLPSATPTRTSSTTAPWPTPPSRDALRLRPTSSSGTASVGSIDPAEQGLSPGRSSPGAPRCSARAVGAGPWGVGRPVGTALPRKQRAPSQPRFASTCSAPPRLGSSADRQSRTRP